MRSNKLNVNSKQKEKKKKKIITHFLARNICGHEIWIKWNDSCPIGVSADSCPAGAP